jgi:HK97 family phage portal protein
MTVASSGILWLPNGLPESRSIFDYETGKFTGAARALAGIRVTEETALESTVVLACLRVLGESVASLPLHVYRRRPDGGKEIARGHPLYRILHVAPNDWQTSFEWREQQMLHLGTYGQSFSEIVLGAGGGVRSLVPLHPSRMTVERVESGRLRYRYLEEPGGFTTYAQEQVMHIRWLSDDGVCGMVPVQLAQDAIALARACEVHGAAFFGNGARPGVVLATDSTLSQEAAEMLRNNWERIHRGPDRAGRTAVLMGGLKPVELGVNNQDSQYLETRRFQIEEICRLYRVPPHLVGDLTRSSFSNVEQQSLDFVQHTLLPWLRRFESAFARDLLLDDEHFVEFDTRGLLRGDAAGRAAYYQTLWNLGVASVNEIRGWENLNPVEGGDTRFVQLNMQTLEAATAKPEQPPVPPEPVASVNELVSVLGQVASGTVGAESAKAIMAAVFPTLPPELATQILTGVSGPPPETPPAPVPEKPAADVGGLVTILAQVKDGSLKPEGAVAALGSVFPDLPPATAEAIVAGVSPPEAPPKPEEPTADVNGLLAILAQVSQGAVTPEAALAIIRAVFPTMPESLAQAIVAGAKEQQPPPAETPPPAAEPETEAPQEEQAATRGFCPTGPGGGVDNSCGAGSKEPGSGRVLAADYGMDYSPANAQVVEKARGVPDEEWNTLPVETLPHGTALKANEETLNTAPIEKVVSGREPFREGYVTKLWRTNEGDLHIVDGHHRVAMYHALRREMPVRIMDQADYERLTAGRRSQRAFCPTGPGGGVDNSCSARKGTAADVSVASLEKHAERVAGGSYIDGGITSEDFPDGAVVPRDVERLRTHHAEVKRELAERIGVASVKATDMGNAASMVEELLADARAVAPAFKSLTETAAKDSGSEVSFGTADPKNNAHDYLREHAFGTHMLKIPDSVAGKVPRIRNEDGYGPETPDSDIVQRYLKDTVRGTLISDTPEALGDAVRSVQRQAEDAGLKVGIKNRFEDAAKTGYGAVHMTLQMQTPAGRPIMTELQFHLRAAYDGNAGSPKDNSHGLYKPDPKTNSVSEASAAAQMLIWSRAFEDVVARRPRRRRSLRGFCPTGPGGGVDNSCGSSQGSSGKKKGGRPRPKRVPTRRPSKREVLLASQEGASPRQIAARKVVAAHFLHGQGAFLDRTSGDLKPLDEDRFTGQMQAIDWTKPVEIGPPPNLPPPAHLVQWQAPGNIPPAGGYFSKPGTQPEELGIGRRGTAWKVEGQPVVEKEPHDFEVRGTPHYLRSTAAPAVDTWSIQDRRPQAANGGGPQWFVPDAQASGGIDEFIFRGRMRRRSARAFCPTGPGGGVDNSCSSRKGGRSPKAPEPDGRADAADSRGGATGHSVEQREAHIAAITDWLDAKGIKLTVDGDGRGPPNMHALEAVTAGIDKLEDLKLRLPREIVIQRLPAPAAYSPTEDAVLVDLDYDRDSIENAIQTGGLAGDPKQVAAGALVHEMAHADHWVSLGEDINTWRDWMGRRDFFGPTIDPWQPTLRAAANAKRRGKMLNSPAAQEIAQSVSDYAATCPLEFVAEVRTGVAMGRKYPKIVMNLYEDYQGPELPKVPRKKPKPGKRKPAKQRS